MNIKVDICSHDGRIPSVVRLLNIINVNEHLAVYSFLIHKRKKKEIIHNEHKSGNMSSCGLKT